MKVRNIEAACKAAYEHGRMDFFAGRECDPHIPLRVYESTDDEQRIRIMESWMNGWTDESVMQSLPDGMPA